MIKFGSLFEKNEVKQCGYCGCDCTADAKRINGNLCCKRCGLLLEGYKNANNYDTLQEFLATSGFAFCPTCGAKSAEEVIMMDRGNFAEAICSNCGQMHIINCNIDIMKDFLNTMKNK